LFFFGWGGGGGGGEFPYERSSDMLF